VLKELSASDVQLVNGIGSIGPTTSRDAVYRRGKAAGFTLEWEEKPYEWIEGRHFRQAREFTKGPFRRFGPVFEIVPEGHRSKVSYTLECEPLTWVGRLFGNRLLRQAGDMVEKRILQAAAFAKGDRPTMFELPPPELPSGARERAAALADAIDRSPYGNGLGKRLTEYVLTSMAADLTHLRPKVLARNWDVALRPVIEACLATFRMFCTLKNTGASTAVRANSTINKIIVTW